MVTGPLCGPEYRAWLQGLSAGRNTVHGYRASLYRAWLQGLSAGRNGQLNSGKARISGANRGDSLVQIAGANTLAPEDGVETL